MGITHQHGKKGGIHGDSRELKRVVICWARRNYLKIREQNVDVANTALIGTITFDAEKNQLVKTYDKGLDKVAPKDILQLDELQPSPAPSAGPSIGGGGGDGAGV